MGTGRKHRGVRVASSTSIEITFQYQGRQCRERLPLEPTPANLARAARHRVAVIASIEAGTFDYRTTFPGSRAGRRYQPASPLLRDYLHQWWQQERPYLKASTANVDQRTLYNQLVPALGHLTLADLTWQAIRDWARAQNWSPKTQNNKLSLLRRALNDAVETGLLDHHPMAGKVLRNRRTRGAGRPADAIEPFDQAERAAILRTTTGQLRNLVTVGFWTGLRLSELFALEWRNIDWVHNRIHVDAALTQAADQIETTKTRAGERSVDLLPDALAALQNQKTYTYLAGGAVFHNRTTGQRWSGEATFRTRAWTTLLKRAGVRYRPPKQMRHTYASMMLIAGESPQWVAAQMGHRDWTFTARTYYRWIPKDAPDSGQKAVARWSEKKTKKSAQNA